MVGESVGMIPQFAGGENSAFDPLVARRAAAHPSAAGAGWESFADSAKNAAERHPKNGLGELH